DRAQEGAVVSRRARALRPRGPPRTRARPRARGLHERPRPHRRRGPRHNGRPPRARHRGRRAGGAGRRLRSPRPAPRARPSRRPPLSRPGLLARIRLPAQGVQVGSRAMRRLMVLTLVAALALTACSSSKKKTASSGTTSTSASTRVTGQAYSPEDGSTQGVNGTGIVIDLAFRSKEPAP